MLKVDRVSLKVLFVVIWLALTLSMAGWWMYFSLHMVHQMGQGNEALGRVRNMLLWEGAAWMLLLLAGGLTLIYFIFRERAHALKTRTFLAAFTHDLKTSLASLRLQVESLAADLGANTEHSDLLQKLLHDTVRLNLQLENSMYLASSRDFQPFLRAVSMRKLIESMKDQWPDLQVKVEGDCRVMADDRALTSVLSNVFHNAWVHGHAKNVKVSFTRNGRNALVLIADDGSGFSGDRTSLGQLFYRHNPSSGSGVGLYIASQLLGRMGGRIQFQKSPSGFTVQIQLPEVVA